VLLVDEDNDADDVDEQDKPAAEASVYIKLHVINVALRSSRYMMQIT